MNCQRPLVAIGVLILSLSRLSVAATGLSVTQYRQQLHEISERVRSLSDHPDQAGSVIAAIPDQVTVETANREVTVNYRPLKDDLSGVAKADSKLKPEHLEHLRSYLGSLDAQAAACEQPVAEPEQSRQRLEGILARREFRKVHGPGLKETLLARLYRWLGRLLGRIRFGGSGAFGLLQVVVYVFVGAALLILVWWTINRFRGKEEDLPPREIIPFSPSARSWRAWLAEARAQAGQQDWRNAIHLAYWAGISFLESGGAWKPNHARTPREYLRLLSTRNPNHPPLSALTRKFEIVWYGDRPAGRQDFQDTLGELEKLGCR